MTVSLGAKGVVELELVVERREVGPRADEGHALLAIGRRLDSPAWHLVQALDTLVAADGNDPAIDGFADKRAPISPAEKAMIDAAPRSAWTRPRRRSSLGVDALGRTTLTWRAALERLVSRPTVNIEGLVGGYTGPGGKTMLPHTRGGEARPAAGAGHDGGRARSPRSRRISRSAASATSR